MELCMFGGFWMAIGWFWDGFCLGQILMDYGCMFGGFWDRFLIVLGKILDGCWMDA